MEIMAVYSTNLLKYKSKMICWSGEIGQDLHACLNPIPGTGRVKCGGGFCLNPCFKALDSTTVLTQLATTTYQ
jgi:hypothetical protein